MNADDRSKHWDHRQRLWAAIFWLLVIAICLIGLIVRHRIGGTS